MAHELNVEKVNRGINPDRLLDKAVIRKFGRPEDNGQITPAYIRALEEATRDVKLTVEDFKEAAAEAEIAMQKRLAKRNKNKK